MYAQPPPTKERRENDGKADADIPDIKARN